LVHRHLMFLCEVRDRNLKHARNLSWESDFCEPTRRSFHGCPGARKHPQLLAHASPNDPEIGATSNSAATNGSICHRVLNPGPLFLLGPGSKRGTQSAVKSSRRDASTRRDGCPEPLPVSLFPCIGDYKVYQMQKWT
jgi:hypothetical protein